MELAFFTALFVAVLIAFIVVFTRQNKKLKKVSGRGGDFQE